MADDDVMIRFGAQIGDFLTGVEQVRDKIEGLTAPVGALKESLMGLAEAVGVAFAVEKIAEFYEHVVGLGAQVEHLTQQLGVNAEQVGAFSFVAGAMGVGIEGAAFAMERMQRNMAMAAHETGPAATAFEALGIGVKNAHGQLKSMDEILPQIANRFAETANGPEKTTIAIAILGRAGASMIPFLNQGEEGMRRFKQIAEDTGTVMSDKMAHGFEESEIKLFTLKKSIAGLAISMISALKPAIDAVIEGWTILLQRMNLVITSSNQLQLKSVNQQIADLQTQMAAIKQQRDQLFKEGDHPAEFIIDLDRSLLSLGNKMNDLIRKRDELNGKIASESHEEHKPTLPMPDFGKDAGEQMKLWKDALQKQLLDQEVFLADSKRQELEYWEGRLATVQGATIREKALRLSIEGEIFQLKRGIARQDADDYVAGLNAKMEAVKHDFAQVMAIENQKVAFLKASYHEDSRQYQDALREKERLEREHQDIVNRIQLAHDNVSREISKLSIDMERQRLDTLVQLNQISETDRLNSEREFLQREFQMKMDALQQELKLPRLNEQQISEVNERIRLLQKQHAVEMDRINQQQLQTAHQQWSSFFGFITSGFNSMIQGVLQGTQTLSQMWRRILQNMVLSFMGARLQIEISWLAGQAAMAFGAQRWANQSLIAWVLTKLGIIAASDEAAVDATAAAGARATAEGTAAASVATYWTISSAIVAGAASAAALSAAFDFALEGAVAAMASVAAIPLIGWEMAPEVGAEFFENAMIYTAGIGASVGLATGTMDVPQDMPANLHAGEMVIPKPFADSLREGGGFGGATFAPTIAPVVYGRLNAADIHGLKSAIIDASRSAHRDFINLQKRN